ncbi:MAG: HPF/RaiA family ribosome-associated protein [Myxococcaceae bacterium]
MIIQINTDATLTGHEDRRDAIKGVVIGALTHFSDRISRVEVHLSDEDGRGHGKNDVRCVMEVRIAGRNPEAVTHHATVLLDAVDGAAEKLQRVLEHALGREQQHHRETVRHP